MPLLKDVVQEFKKGFQYVDDQGQRQNRWYEFWHKNATLKEKCTDEKLTASLEKIATKCNTELDALVLQSGEENFEQAKAKFLLIIANTLHAVQVQRFVHGAVKTEQFDKDNEHVFERSLVPKKASRFEPLLIAGLDEVKTKFPELRPLMNEVGNKITASKPNPTTFFHENRKLLNGKWSYTTQSIVELETTYHNATDRENYAKTAISPVVF